MVGVLAPSSASYIADLLPCFLAMILHRSAPDVKGGK